MAAVAAVTGACGADSNEPAETYVLVEVPPETRALESLPLASLFPDRPIPVKPFIERNLRQADAAAAGWETEVWARQAEDALTGLFTAALRGEEVPKGLLAPDFAGASKLHGELLPLAGGALAERHDTEDLWSPERGEPLAKDVAAQLGAPGDDLGELQSVRAELVRMLPVDDGGVEGADSRARVQIVWRRGSGRTQYNGAWTARWSRDASGLKLVELRRQDAELVRTDEPLLADVTGFVFADATCFPDEYLRPPEAYYYHSDRLTEYDMWGNFGFALGDVDDDGWEDVYVCTAGGMPNRLFLRRPDGSTVEASEEWGVAFLDSTRSAVILDLDGDGRRDLAAAVGGDVVVAWNAGGSFGPTTRLASPGTDDTYGISVSDPDGDGDLDLFVNRYGVGMMDRGRGPSRVMRKVPTPFNDAFNGAANVYWRNEGERNFVDATTDVGLDENNIKFSFSSIWEDFDGDGDPDLYVTNDFGRNHYYVNEGGHFRDVAHENGSDDMASGMGPSCGDFDLDGDVDIYISNVYAPEGLRITEYVERFRGAEDTGALTHCRRLARGNTLLRNNGDGTFTDVSVELGANRTGWCWGGRFLDIDNDRYEDLFVPNGWYTQAGTRDVNDFFWRFVIARSPTEGNPSIEYGHAMATIEHLALEGANTWAGDEFDNLLMNQGGGRFVESNGLYRSERPMDGRAVAGIDWDRDGRLDLVLKNRDAPRLQLFHNRAPVEEHGWLVVELEGQAPNRDAIGAQVLVHLEGGDVLRRTVYGGDGFLSQTPRRQHFGLGADAAIESVEVRWPGGVRQTYESGFEPNHAYHLAVGEEHPRPLEWTPIPGFAELPGETPATLDGPRRNVVVLAELPLAPVPLPGFEGGDRQVRDLAGGPALITFWSSADEASLGQVRRFARERAALGAAGLTVVPVTTDDGGALVAARKAAGELGFGAIGGYADRRLLLVYEVLLGEVLPRTGNNLLPTSLLLNSQGDLCVVYHGPVRVADVLEHAAAIEPAGSAGDTGEVLTRGRWLTRPSRDFAGIAKTLDDLSYSELASFYRERAGGRE